MAVVWLLLASGGCGGPDFVAREAFVSWDENQLLEIANTKASEYRIQEGDILKIAFAFESRLNQEGVVVLADGSVTLVGIDRQILAGLTVTEADSIITRAYSRDYRDPDLSVIVQETKGRAVYVMGRVGSPGLHKVPRGGFSILSAIGAAGGFAEGAVRDGVVLLRVSEAGYSVQEFNLEDLSDPMTSQLATLDLRPYDVIYVPTSRVSDFAYFSRSVLAGIMSLTRIASDMRYLSDGGLGRY
ncbi:MAG: polysaccharide biosynthesis/export family protein [bacterium]